MESSSKTIKANLRGPSKRNKSKKYSPTRDDSKVTLPLKEKRREALQRSVSRRNKSKQSLKNKEGGKHGSLQRQPSGRKNTSNGGYYEQNHIKEPKARSNLKKKGSSLKKYEQEKQALLIMEQMLSQVKEFTNKERSKDTLTTRSSQILSLARSEKGSGKRLSRGFVGSLEKEMKKCGLDVMKVTKDFYNHHSRSMKLRIDMYHNVLNHPDTLEELQSISSKHSNERNAKGNDLLDLYNNENKLLKVAENFATTMKNSEDEAELEAFDAQFQEFGKHMKTIEEKETSTFKRAYKSKEGDRTLNKIMDRIYTDLSSEYDKRIYNPPENSENITAKLESPKQGADRAESDNTEEDTRQTKQSRGSKKVWSNLEIVNLLKGIYQYGEPKWQEIHSSYEFNDKTPHDLSVKWMDLRYQISEQQKRLENTSSKKSNQSRFPQISKDKNGGFDRNGEIQEYSEEPKNWLIKSEKKIMTPVPDSKGVFNKIPILDNSAKPLPRSTEEDPQMLYWLEMIKRRMPIFRIKKNASRDDISDSSSNFDERGRYKRRRLNSEGEYESCSDYAGDSIICPKIMYGTINTIYKDSIQIADTESNPGLVDLGKKYYSKSLFTIDKSQHKKILKRKRKEELKIKKKMEHKEEMRLKKEQQKKLMMMLNEKEAENKAENEGSTKQKITKKRVLKKI